MRKILIRFQIGVVSAALLATFVMLMAMMNRHERRLDLTREKIYSLAPETQALLKAMKDAPIEIRAFFPARDPNRADLEIFLRDAAAVHGRLDYAFYDPERRPDIARQMNVREAFTVILRTRGYEERLVTPDEERFATALLRLQRPREVRLCSVTGHNEAVFGDDKERGLSELGHLLRERHYQLREIPFTEGGVPSDCDMVFAAGPQKRWGADELTALSAYLRRGGHVLFLVDPMDKESGEVFMQFLAGFGLRLRGDVIVDKMSRVVGGDFLVPYVNQFDPEHAWTRGLQDPVFLPVTRTVAALEEKKDGLDVQAVAFAGSNSWGESDLAKLEQGEAVFDPAEDTPGPLPVAAAVLVSAPKTGQGAAVVGRLAVVGDSDFIRNSYLTLAGNREWTLRTFDWTSGEDRHVTLQAHAAAFTPYALSSFQRAVLILCTAILLPLVFLAAGAAGILWRRRA